MPIPSKQLTVDVRKAQEDRPFLTAMASDSAGDPKLCARAKLILAMADGATLPAAAAAAGISVPTSRKRLAQFNAGGWQALLTVNAPRGGDFLAHYDQGFWAERLTRVYVDQSFDVRAIPYGTSISEPFTDMQSFRQHIETEYILQAWSAGGRWKRPDLLLIPRQVLIDERGNDAWTPDLKHFNNEDCNAYLHSATAAIEVETSLWQTRVATVQLSFTIKLEDIGALRNWAAANKPPLFIVQVFYDRAYAIPFRTVEEVIALPVTDVRHVAADVDRKTKKATYKVPLSEGVLLGDIAEPDVEGKLFKAPNGKVTVYGRLNGSAIETADAATLRALATGSLSSLR